MSDEKMNAERVVYMLEHLAGMICKMSAFIEEFSSDEVKKANTPLYADGEIAQANEWVEEQGKAQERVEQCCNCCAICCSGYITANLLLTRGDMSDVKLPCPSYKKKGATP